MADLGSPTWSEIDASNTAVPPNGWPEGMAPSDVNNAARAQMGGEKRWWDRSNATQTTTGTSTAYVLTYAAAESALYDGEETSFVLHVNCGANPTLNRDGLGAKFLRRFDFATNAFIAVVAGEFRINQVLRVRYNLADDRYDIIGASIASGDFVVLSANNTFTGTNTFANTVTMSGAAFNGAARVNVASATTCAIGAAVSNYVRITGTTTITGMGTVASGVYRDVVFAAALTLTHNATSLILPTGANIVTAAGDTAGFVSDGGGNWKCLWYQRANAVPVGAVYFTNTLGANVAMNNTGLWFTGPTVAQGATGVFLATGTVTINAAAGGARVATRLTDGTNIKASTTTTWPSAQTPAVVTESLSGIFINPPGNIRIEANNADSTLGGFLYNQTGQSADCTLVVQRIG